MKKIYLLALFCLLGTALFAQSTVVTIYATGSTGSYTTGSSTTTTRTDGNIVSSSSSAGYAVFDLSSIPAGCVIQAVTPGFYTSAYTGSGAPTGCNTYGYPGDLSAVTLAGTLYSDMTSTAGGSTLLSSAAYTAGVGLNVITSTPASVAFVQANIGGKVSVSVSGGASRVLTMVGETGNTTSISTVGHAPYLQISYCKTPSVATASASPTTLCAGDMLSLSGSATDASNYEWNGPGGYFVTGTTAAATLTTTLASAGVYTLTAINACGTFSTTVTSTTASVVVNPIPNPIVGISNICTGNAFTFTDPTFSGNWLSDNPTAVSIGFSSGVILGVGAGVANISYQLSTGCFITTTVTDNDAPTAISGPASDLICQGTSIGLSDGITGGTWTISGPAGTSINSSTGVVTSIGGATLGTANVTYTMAGCPAVNYTITIDPVPANFTGSALLCTNTTTLLGETTTGGTWWSSSSSTALVGTDGLVTGESAGFANIDYILPTGCKYTEGVFVYSAPAPIVSSGRVCVGATGSLSDATSGGTFGPATGTYATIVPGSGLETGTLAGVQTFTYTVNYTVPAAYSCAVTTTVTIDPAPAAIVGPAKMCENSTAIYTDPDLGGSWLTYTPTTTTVNATTGEVTALTAGPGTIVYLNSYVCATTLNITVNPLPVSVITAGGPTTFCVGGNVVLTGSAGAGLSYQWDEAGVPITGATNISYTATTTDNFTVDVTDGNGCVGTSAATPVTAGINPVIVYSTSPSFCIGNYIVLDISTGTASGTILYQWQLNGVDIPGAAGDNYAATTPGIYTCNVSISGGSGICTATTATSVTVTVNPIPTPTITSSSSALSTVSPYSGYQWFLNTVTIPGANGRTYIPHSTGSYRVEVTDANGCVGFSTAFLVDNVGVAQINKADISLYPNPATEVLHIDAPATVRGVISSMDGKVIIDQQNAKEIDIHRLSGGVYLLALYDEHGNRVLVDKLIKE